jgi:integrase/recombinase XerD
MKLSNSIEGFILEISTSYLLGTIKLYRMYLNKFLEWIGDREIEKIQPADLSRYLAYMRTEYKPARLNGDTSPLSPSALDNHWKVLRSFFKWCNTILEVPRPDLNLRRPKYKLPEVMPFSAEDLKKILYACEYSKAISKEGMKTYRLKKKNRFRDRALIMLMLDTGLRISELARLKPEDINAESGEILVAPAGSGQKTKPRVVYLGKNSRRAMWLWMAQRRDTDRLFGIDEKRIRALVHSIGYSAGVSSCTPIVLDIPSLSNSSGMEAMHLPYNVYWDTALLKWYSITCIL